MKPSRRRHWKRRMLTTALLPLIVYLVVCLLVFVFQRRLLYFPDDDRGSPSIACDELPLDITGPQGRIQAWLLRPELLGQRPLLVYCGGNAANASYSRQRFDGRDWPTLCWNYPGYGGSAGSPTERDIIAAGRALLDGIDQLAPQTPIIFMGSSLGAAVATALAAGRDAAGLVLVAPSASLADVAADHFPLLPARWLMRDSWPSAARTANLRCPLLTIIAGDDRTIAPHHSQAFVDAYPAEKELHVLERRHHDNVDDAPEFWPLVEAFVARIAATVS